MYIEYLSAEFIFFIHTVAIDEEFCEYGGQVRYAEEMRGVKDKNLFESAVFEPQQSFAEQDLYPDIISKAACYLRSIAMNHPFYDGNKRTALLSTIVFLEMNGYKVTGSNDELYNLVKEIVEQKNSIEEISEKIKPYIRASKMNKIKKIFKDGNNFFKKVIKFKD